MLSSTYLCSKFKTCLFFRLISYLNNKTASTGSKITPINYFAFFLYSKHRDSVHNSDLDTYSMPHWINLSFYSKGKTVGYSNFKSRISIPRSVDSRISKPKPQCCQADTAMLRNNVKNPISVDPYDAGDAYDDR